MNRTPTDIQCTTPSTQWLSPLLFAIYVLSVFVPWVPRSWQPPCNNAWVLVLHDAFLGQAAFGSDVVWTFGPYGFLYFGAVPQTYLLTLFGWVLFSAAYGLVVWRIMRQRDMPDLARLAIAVILTGVVATVDVVDAQVYAFAAFVSATWLLTSPKDLTLTILTGIALALASLIKFSWFMAIAPCVLALSTYELFHERRPAFLGLIYCASGIALWLASGQALASLPTYLSVSLEVAGGYAEAMQLAPPWGIASALAYLAVALPLVGLVSLSRSLEQPARSVLAGVIAYLLFIAFKAGFVRNDYHEVVSMATLLAVSVLAFCLQKREQTPRSLALAMLGASGALFGIIFLIHHNNPSFQHRLAQSTQLDGVVALARFITGDIDAEKICRDDMAAIARSQPLSVPAGTIDIYPWEGSGLIYAHNLQLRHRPIFESYSAYTPHLTTLNQRFLTGTTAPAQLLFAVRSLDQRLPAMDDGLSWPDIIARYELQGQQAGYLWMTRRQHPKNVRLTPAGEAVLQPNNAVTLPEDSLVWMQIDIPLTPFGRLLKVFYKTPTLVLIVQPTAGKVQAFRHVPGVGPTGFLISPLILNTAAFAALHARPDDPRLAALRTSAIALAGESGFTLCYDFSRSRVRFSTLDFGPDAPQENRGSPD